MHDNMVLGLKWIQINAKPVCQSYLNINCAWWRENKNCQLAMALSFLTHCVSDIIMWRLKSWLTSKKYRSVEKLKKIRGCLQSQVPCLSLMLILQLSCMLLKSTSRSFWRRSRVLILCWRRLHTWGGSKSWSKQCHLRSSNLLGVLWRTSWCCSSIWICWYWCWKCSSTWKFLACHNELKTLSKMSGSI